MDYTKSLSDGSDRFQQFSSCKRFSEITVCTRSVLAKDILGRLGSEKDEGNCCRDRLDVGSEHLYPSSSGILTSHKIKSGTISLPTAIQRRHLQLQLH